MNINFLKSSLFAFGCFCAAVAPAQTGSEAKVAKMNGNKNFYNIKVKIEDYPNDTLILGYRLGKQTYVKDTCVGKNDKGEFVFSKKDTLKGGIYLALLKPSNNYFEFLVPNDKDQQNMSVFTKITPENDLVKHLKVEGSDDNKVFIDYLHYLGTIRERSEAYNKERETVAKDSNKVKEIDKKQLALNDEVNEYQKNLFTKYPNYLSTKLIKSSGAPIVPKDIEAQGQEASYRYYKANYFNDVDLADARLIRTPILEEKIEFFLEKLVFQVPDSLNKDIDYLMDLIQKGKNKDVHQYAASHILNKYAKSQVICMDAVYVHVGDKYYCKAKPDWVEKEQLEKICDNVEELRPLRCGAPALEIVAKNIADSSQFKLSNLVGKRRYTVLFFFDPACGNCGKAAMRLAPVYDRFKSFGVEVIGVCSKEWKEVEECRKSAKEKGMKWINLSDEAYPLAVIKKSYAIKMNPYIYLYDEDMKLMFKRLDPEQVDEIIQREFKMMLEGKLKNRMQLTPQERPALEKALKEAEKEAAQRKADEEKKKKEEEEQKKKTENK